MTKLKTAPQILEHYFPEILFSAFWKHEKPILKAMRHYARVKSSHKAIYGTSLDEIESRVRNSLREEVKDEMYEEARENILIQYNLK